MINSEKVKASKGSKRQMQIVSLDENQHYLNEFLKDKLKWFSPIIEENFKEYQINNQQICKKLGYKPTEFKDFWPSRQPQWDGIALGESGTLYLFEAKSHLSEIQRRGKRGSEENNNKIFTSIQNTAIVFGNDLNANEELKASWCDYFYQISNRITFAVKLNSFRNTNYKKVAMVFLNFVNDRTWNSKQMVINEDIWRKHYDDIFRKMGLTDEQLSSNGIMNLTFNLDDGSITCI